MSKQRVELLTRLLQRERQRDAERVLLELPEAMREAILLRFHDALAYEDIATIVGAPESTVRSRVFHGVSKCAPGSGKERGDDPAMSV